MKQTRRELMKMAARALPVAGAWSVAGRLTQMSALAACANDYRALVCVFLFGGNDGNNLVVPVTTPATNPDNSYQSYARVRGGLALGQETLELIQTQKGDTYGLHPSLKEMAELYTKKGNVAVLANTGTLVEPLTRATYQQKTGDLPSNLFSHLDQQTAWQTAAAQGFSATGWGGRMADAMAECHTGKLPMLVSMSGNVLFAEGAKTNAATVTPGQALGLQGFGTTAAGAARMEAVKRLMEYSGGLELVKSANAIASMGLEQAGILNDALAGSAALKTVFPATSLGQQMQQIARIIQVRGALGASRQIFFASLGGFDTHDRELIDQASGLAAVSQAMRAFHEATVEMGVSGNVVTFTESDFGRTFQPSGGATLGTDHAWGSHHLIMGDAVKGGDLYGKFPTLAVNGPDDANNRGVWIPTTSLEQYGSTLARWFGVPDEKLAQVFPNLKNFSEAGPAFL
ncbi:MAG: DUF1501 domain-containing protein [Acidobacteria bacterium]|nr:DUF1501 domain-containing protein [Acidobacteriota bacterium]